MCRIIGFVAFCFVFMCTEGARILGVFPSPWNSHYFLGEKLMKGIAQAGHNVTYVTPYHTKNIPENVSFHDVVLEGLPEQFDQIIAQDETLNYRKPGRIFYRFQVYGEWGFHICNMTLTHPNLKKLLSSGESFDIVILGQGFANECLLVLPYLFKGHAIMASTIGPQFYSSKKIGNPYSLSTVSNLLEYIPDLGQEFGLIPRLKNLFYMMETYLACELFLLPLQRDLASRLFPGVPNVESLGYNVSLVLLNSHYSYYKAEPMVPNSIEIGGYHVDPPKKLPKDLQEFLDNATTGAIYFSLGSTVKSKDLPEWKKAIFLDVFKSLRVKVLWKFEADLLGKPDNVLIKSWMPQQDILAHPNIKLFITHGGMLSSIETVYHGVPVLCLPMFGDQEMNSHKAEVAGYGLKLDFQDENFNAESLKNALDELLYNPKYSKTAKKLSRVFHDRPLNPMQTAVYWIEYVIRHEGAPHLRVAGVGLPWYKYYMIDVAGVVLSGILFSLFSIGLTIKLVLTKLRWSQLNSKSKMS